MEGLGGGGIIDGGIDDFVFQGIAGFSVPGIRKVHSLILLEKPRAGRKRDVLMKG